MLRNIGPAAAGPAGPAATALKWNAYSIAYRLSNNCTKNYYNRGINIRIMLK